MGSSLWCLKNEDKLQSTPTVEGSRTHITRQISMPGEMKPVVHRQYMVSGNLALLRLPLTIYCLWTTGFFDDIDCEQGSGPKGAMFCRMQGIFCPSIRPSVGQAFVKIVENRAFLHESLLQPIRNVEK